MISQAIKSAFKKKKERGWDKLYWCIDMHDSIIKGEYSSKQKYDAPADAVEVLKWLSGRKDMVIIIWTSSYAKDFAKLVTAFAIKYGIAFDYFNENPECENTELADFNKKMYFNVLIDDKAGFDMDTDWKEIKNTLIELGEWKKD